MHAVEERMREIMWVLDYEDDIASDLSAFHRIDEPLSIPAVRYFSLAVRLTAYMGVMAARVAKLNEGAEQHAAPSGSSSPSRESRVDDSTALAMLEADGWVEHTVTEG